MPRSPSRFWLAYGVALAALGPAVAHAQAELLPAEAAQEVNGAGWAGFADVGFLGHAVLVLSLATALGTAIAYHPRTPKRVDSASEAEAPRVYVTYAVVGAVIGLMVVEYGLVVGFVVFGIGGLFRFRTTLPSVAGTGRLIFVTLIGLSCGLDLPHLGVLATAFGFALFYVMDRTVTYQLEVQDLARTDVVEAAAAYRGLIEAHGGRVLREKKSFSKAQVTFVFQVPYRFQREDLERAAEEGLPDPLRGAVDWEVD